MNQYKDSTILRFINHYETLEPAISKGSIILAHGILQKIKSGITTSYYEENKINVDKFLTKIQSRATELDIDISHEFNKTMADVQAIINPEQMAIEDCEKLNLKPILIERTPYIDYTMKRKKSYEKKTQSISS